MMVLALYYIWCLEGYLVEVRAWSVASVRLRGEGLACPLRQSVVRLSAAALSMMGALPVCAVGHPHTNAVVRSAISWSTCLANVRECAY